MKINKLVDGSRGGFDALIAQVNKGVTNKGATYLTLELQDDTKSIISKYWDVDEALASSLNAGDFVHVQGDVILYQNNLQFRIRELNILDKEKLDIRAFVQQGPINKAELKQQMKQYVDMIKSPSIKTMIDAILKDFEKDFYEYPGATRNHHAFVGGLATHVVQMLQLADTICKQYELLNQDLLYGGIILHDIGKLIEFSEAVLPEYTIEGKLLGHISIMQSIVAKKADELNIQGEEVVLLRHMILSHHGQYEYGSPVLPMIPEAEILYLIDNIDARMSSMTKALNDIEEGSFTKRIFAMENRSLYKAKKNNDN